MAEIVTIKGLDELNRKLKELPIKLQKTIVRKALGAGSQVIKKAAIALAPISSMPVHRRKGRVTQPGVLKAAAIVKFVREQSNDTQSVEIITFRRGPKAQRVGKTASNKDAFYASWVEFGHKIVPRFKGKYTDYRLYGRKRLTGLRTRRRAAEAAGGARVAGRRFLTQAFTNAGHQALAVFEAKLRAGFDAAVK